MLRFGQLGLDEGANAELTTEHNLRMQFIEERLCSMDVVSPVVKVEQPDAGDGTESEGGVAAGPLAFSVPTHLCSTESETEEEESASQRSLLNAEERQRSAVNEVLSKIRNNAAGADSANGSERERARPREVRTDLAGPEDRSRSKQNQALELSLCHKLANQKPPVVDCGEVARPTSGKRRRGPSQSRERQAHGSDLLRRDDRRPSPRTKHSTCVRSHRSPGRETRSARDRSPRGRERRLSGGRRAREQRSPRDLRHRRPQRGSRDPCRERRSGRGHEERSTGGGTARPRHRSGPAVEAASESHGRALGDGPVTRSGLSSAQSDASGKARAPLQNHSVACAHGHANWFHSCQPCRAAFLKDCNQREQKKLNPSNLCLSFCRDDGNSCPPGACYHQTKRGFCHYDHPPREMLLAAQVRAGTNSDVDAVVKALRSLIVESHSV